MKTFNPDSIIITPKQLDVLKEIEAFHVRQCYSPTMEEIGRSLGVNVPPYSSTSKNFAKRTIEASYKGQGAGTLFTARNQRKLLERVASTKVSPQGDAMISR
jgi:hypothetical protein